MNRSRSLIVGSVVTGFIISAVGHVRAQQSYKVEIIDPQWGLRVQTNTTGGQVGSFGGLGEFDVDAPNVVGGRLAVKEGSGNVGIGIPDPAQKLSVAGRIESTTGGFKFPDGTIQTTAAVATNPNSFVQNTTTPQAANFNITGSGKAASLSASVIDSTNGYSIEGITALAISLDNQNTATGRDAGLGNSGVSNSFYGDRAGNQGVSGSDNSFFGVESGSGNTSGSLNSFFGVESGYSAQGSSNNAYFGAVSGFNSQGDRNSFFGVNAGWSNGAGSSNTLVGYISVTTGTLTNATAIGANAQVSQSNSLVLGSINGVNGANADTKVGIGTTAPSDRLHVNGRVRVVAGDVFVAHPNTLIITSPNGACWGITVNNSGGLSTFSTACP